MIFGLTKK